MNSGRTIFSQLIDFLPSPDFRKCVARYRGNRRMRSFSCWDQLLCMIFAQLTYRESLRDIVTCLGSMGSKLYHAGFRGSLRRSTLADANERRDWRIYGDFAAVLIQRARALYRNDAFPLGLDGPAYAFDSTTIDLCLKLFPWAQFRRRKSAIKLHTLVDLRGNIPCFVHITSGKTADVTTLDHLPIEAGSFYMLDRGYIDFARLHVLTQSLAFFVTRAKRDLDFSRQSHREVDKSTGLRSDQTIVLCGPKTSHLYPQPLRRVSYHAADMNKQLVFLTNNFSLPALVIAMLYKCRWQVELFFKWIKQHLRIKSFYGTSVNAVKTQVWTAMSVYALVAIVKKELGIQRSLSEILQILSIGLFEKTPILQAFSNVSSTIDDIVDHKQLPLFNL